jgi:hypothetical protein
LEFIVTVQVPVAFVHAPLHPANVEFPPAAAVSVTIVPLGKFAEQAVGQLMPDGLVVTVPLPVPASATVSVKFTSVNVAVTA